MVLNFSPPPNFGICDTKIFLPNEKHITRIHKRSVLILMTDGVLRFMENGREITLRKGEYYIQQQGLLQEGVLIDQPPAYFYIEFIGAFSQTSEGLPLRGRFDEKAVLPLTERFGQLFKERSADPFRLNSYMLRIFSELLPRPESDESSTLAGLVKNYLDANYCYKLTLDGISRKFAYSPDYLGAIFKKKFGVTPHAYLTKLRMDRAEWLLENTALSAQQISLECGYEDFSSFFRAFKRCFGISPSRARQKI